MLITTILSIMAWMSLSLTASLQLRKGYGAALLLTACAIILVLFLGMILGVLSLTYYLIIIGAFVQAILRGWSPKILKAQLSFDKFSLPTFANSYVILYGLSLAAIIIFVRKVYPDFAFFGWDEFSHWARYTKILVSTSIAPVDNPAVLFPTYPPGINLWHYFICGPEGYAEWKVVFAQMLLVMSAIVFVSTNFGKLKGLGTLVIFIFGLAIYHAFGTTLYEIYTDCILGLLFAAGLLIARNLALHLPSRTSGISFAIVLAAISLIKPIAILFSITACGLFFGLRLIVLFKNRFLKPLPTDASTVKSHGFVASVLQLSGYLVAAFSTVIIWKIYTSANAVKGQLSDGGKVGFSEVYEFLFTRESTETQIAWKELGDRIGFERISTFGGKQFRLDKGFFDPDFPIYHGAIYLLWVAIAFFALRLIFNHKKFIITIAEGLYLTVTFLIYLLVIVFIIRYFFQLYDIERLASLERYLSSFLIGIMLYALTTLVTDISELKTSKKSDPRRIAFPFMWAAFAMYFLNLAPITLDNVFAKPLNERPVQTVHPWANEYSEMSEIRQQISSLSNVVKSNAEPDDKIYVVAQNETGFTFYMAGHELSPLETNPNCFSVGEKYYEKDNWTCDWTNFPILLKQYDYLVIRWADEPFWKSFGELFEPAAHGFKSGVFKIDKSTETVKLKSLYLSDEALGPDPPT